LKPSPLLKKKIFWKDDQSANNSKATESNTQRRDLEDCHNHQKALVSNAHLKTFGDFAGRFLNKR